MADNVFRLHYDIDGEDFSVAGEASSKIKKTLKQLGVDPQIMRKVAVATYEGEINMVIHANGGTIDVEISPENIVMILKDNGPGIPDINLAMQEGYSTATEQVRELGFGAGMGLPNMKKYTDEMTVDSRLGEGTTITMIVRTNL
ncbi:MAG: anti-sigma regulatory factor [Ruminococcaceae bacterium]|nr:anti-sigma regulatory factor [Oscillospiraceae bacterium]